MYGYFVERSYKGFMPYTDLALERRRADTDVPGIEYRETRCSVGSWERIKISTKPAAESISRPIGDYNTLNLERMDLMTEGDVEDAADELAAELCSMLDDSDIFPGRLLIAGLGSRRLTPDSVGCKSAHRVKATMHIKEFDRRLFERLRCAEIAVCTPDVASASGLDAAVTIRGICDLIQPDAVIAIDALATGSAERLGTTVQICNTGISPGSGLGNPRLAISKETVGVPVIAIGVPTVIDARSLCGMEECSDRGIRPGMFVSPKEIDEIVDNAGKIIGRGINVAFGICDY